MDGPDRNVKSKNALDTAFIYSRCVSVCLCEYALHEYIHHTQRDMSVFPPQGSERLSVFVTAPFP